MDNKTTQDDKIMMFVYGTLKIGERNNKLIIDERFIAATDVRDMVLINKPDYPYAIDRKGRKIHGELYQISEECLEQLDVLEGYPEYYDRKIVNTDDGRAWIYYLNDAKEAKQLENKYGIAGEWDGKD